MMQELGLKTLSTVLNNSIPESTSKKGKNQQPTNQIVTVQIHRSISLMMKIKEIVMMMTLNQKSNHYLWK
jgi:hypothetical protein